MEIRWHSTRDTRVSQELANFCWIDCRAGVGLARLAVICLGLKTSSRVPVDLGTCA
jgi:hypothetical protein